MRPPQAHHHENYRHEVGICSMPQLPITTLGLVSFLFKTSFQYSSQYAGLERFLDPISSRELKLKYRNTRITIYSRASAK